MVYLRQIRMFLLFMFLIVNFSKVYSFNYYSQDNYLVYFDNSPIISSEKGVLTDIFYDFNLDGFYSINEKIYTSDVQREDGYFGLVWSYYPYNKGLQVQSKAPCINISAYTYRCDFSDVVYDVGYDFNIENKSLYIIQNSKVYFKNIGIYYYNFHLRFHLLNDDPLNYYEVYIDNFSNVYSLSNKLATTVRNYYVLKDVNRNFYLYQILCNFSSPVSFSMSYYSPQLITYIHLFEKSYPLYSNYNITTIIGAYPAEYGPNYVLRIYEKEGCVGDLSKANLTYTKSYDSSKYKIDEDLVFYDEKPNWLSLTFANAFNLSYYAWNPPKEEYFYYHGDYYKGIKLKDDDLIAIAKANNITIYSSCRDNDYFIAAYAYKNHALYVDDPAQADKVICQNSEEFYFNHSDFVWGFVVFDESSKWFSILPKYVSKAYPISYVSIDQTKQQINEKFGELITRYASNPKAKLTKPYIYILGDEQTIPMPAYIYKTENTKIPSDLEYAKLPGKDYIVFSIGRVLSPNYNTNPTIESAVLYAQYEQNKYLAFYNRFNGMFTALMFDVLLLRHNVWVDRVVEQRLNFGDPSTYTSLYDNAQTIYSFVQTLVAGSSVPITALLQAMKAIFDIVNTVAMAIHEIDLTYFELSNDFLHLPVLTPEALNYAKDYDFVGYFGILGEKGFYIPVGNETYLVPKQNININKIFYFDYDYSYYLAKHYASQQAQGYALTYEKNNKFAQERGAELLKYLLKQKSLGDALVYSLNDYLVADDYDGLFTSLKQKELFGRVLLGDPQTTLNFPPYLDPQKVVHYKALRNERYRLSALSQTSSIKDTLMFSFYYKNLSDVVYTLNNTINISNNAVYVYSFSLPNNTKIQTLSISLNQENTNFVSAYNATCINTTYKVIDAYNGQKLIYVYIPLICSLNNNLYLTKSAELTIIHEPQTYILDAEINNNTLTINIFSNSYKNSTLYVFANKQPLLQKTLTLAQNLNTFSLTLPKLSGVINYVIVLDNTTYEITTKQKLSLNITELYPDPQNEELEFIEFYYPYDVPYYANLTLYETKTHNFNVLLEKGYYLIAKNVSAIEQEFGFSNNSRIIEIPISLNNNGEQIVIYDGSEPIINLSYVPKDCAKNDGCSIHYNQSIYYAPPTPLAPYTQTYERINAYAYLLSNQLYPDDQIKIKVKKSSCTNYTTITLNYSIANYNGSISEEVYCSKTFTLPIYGKFLDKGSYVLNYSLTYNNQTINYQDVIYVLGYKDILCSLSPHIITKDYYDSEPISLDVYVADLLCQGKRYDYELVVELKDKDGKTINKKTLTKSMSSCSSKHSVSFDSDALEGVYYIDVYISEALCANQNPDKISKPIYVVSQPKTYTFDQQTSQTSTSTTTSSSFSSYTPITKPKSKEKANIQLINISLDYGKVYASIIYNAKTNNSLQIYSYLIGDDRKLYSYACNNKKGWKANLMNLSSTNSNISLSLCLKPEAYNKTLKYVVKLVVDGKTYMNQTYIYIPPKIEQTTNITPFFNATCEIYDEFIILNVFTNTKHNLTIETDTNTFQKIVSNNETSIYKTSYLIVKENNKTILKCQEQTKNNAFTGFATKGFTSLYDLILKILSIFF